MIEVTTFEIQKGTSVLHLKMAVKSLSYYTSVYLSEVKIYTQDTFSASNPGTPVFTKTYTGSVKSDELFITEGQTQKSTKSNIFIAVIKTKGNPSSDTPCGMDKDTTITAAFDVCNVWNVIMNNVKELNDSCTIPKQFIDILLQYEAVSLAIKTGNIEKAVDLYKKFYMKPTFRPSPSCGCHG